MPRPADSGERPDARLAARPATPAACHALGFTVHPGTLDDYLALIRRSITAREPCTVLYHNLHSLYGYVRSAEVRRTYSGSTVLVDGMPVIGLLRAAGFDARREQRLTYVDFIMPMMRLARDEGYRVFHLGQSAEVQRVALDRIRDELPGIELRGRDGYFDQAPGSVDNLEVIREINASDTDLLLVGFGAPRQETWLHAHRELIDAPAVFACGACMEYVAGEVRTPPRWMGRAGLEWSFRLFENPRRFAFRYLVEPLVLGAVLGPRLIAARLGGGRGATASRPES